MIFSSVRNRARFPVSLMERTLRLCGDPALASLPAGRVALDGTRLFAVVQSYQTAPEETLSYEAHRAYYDVQYILSGEERILTAPLERCPAPLGPYSEEEDIIFLADPPGAVNALCLRAGDFAVFGPGDAHKTRCSLPGAAPGPVKKIIFKLAAGGADEGGEKTEGRD